MASLEVHNISCYGTYIIHRFSQHASIRFQVFFSAMAGQDVRHEECDGAG